MSTGGVYRTSRRVVDVQNSERSDPGRRSMIQFNPQEVEDAMEKKEDIDIHLFMIGSKGDGRSTLRRSICYQTFGNNVKPTISLEEYENVFVCKLFEVRVNLSFYDARGKEKNNSFFRKLCERQKLQKINSMLISYDVVNRRSFDLVKRHFNVFQKTRSEKNLPQLPTILVGLKTDLRSSGTEGFVTKEEGEMLAKELNIPYRECSSKTGEGIRDVLIAVVGMIGDSPKLYRVILDGNLTSVQTLFNSFLRIHNTYTGNMDSIFQTKNMSRVNFGRNQVYCNVSSSNPGFKTYFVMPKTENELRLERRSLVAAKQNHKVDHMAFQFVKVEKEIQRDIIYPNSSVIVRCCSVRSTLEESRSYINYSNVNLSGTPRLLVFVDVDEPVWKINLREIETLKNETGCSSTVFVSSQFGFNCRNVINDCGKWIRSVRTTPKEQKVVELRRFFKNVRNLNIRTCLSLMRVEKSEFQSLREQSVTFLAKSNERIGSLRKRPVFCMKLYHLKQKIAEEKKELEKIKELFSHFKVVMNGYQFGFLWRAKLAVLRLKHPRSYFKDLRTKFIECRRDVIKNFWEWNKRLCNVGLIMQKTELFKHHSFRGTDSIIPIEQVNNPLHHCREQLKALVAEFDHRKGHFKKIFKYTVESLKEMKSKYHEFYKDVQDNIEEQKLKAKDVEEFREVFKKYCDEDRDKMMKDCRKRWEFLVKDMVEESDFSETKNIIQISNPLIKKLYSLEEKWVEIHRLDAEMRTKALTTFITKLAGKDSDEDWKYKFRLTIEEDVWLANWRYQDATTKLENFFKLRQTKEEEEGYKEEEEKKSFDEETEGEEEEKEEEEDWVFLQKKKNIEVKSPKELYKLLDSAMTCFKRKFMVMDNFEGKKNQIFIGNVCEQTTTTTTTDESKEEEEEEKEKVLLLPHGEGFVFQKVGSGKKLQYSLVYEGGVKNGLKSGKGREMNMEGVETYEGQWKKGVPHGKGILHDEKTGQVIEGDFVKGQNVKKDKVFNFEIIKIGKIIKQLDERHKIGQGGNGTIYKIKMQRKHFAAKIIKIDKQFSVFRERQFRENVRICASFLHDNVIRTTHLVVGEKKMGFLMELMDESLDHYIARKRKKLPINEKIWILYETACGMEYVHKLGIMHRDLKWGNVLKKGNNIKLTDFDTCKNDESAYRFDFISTVTGMGTSVFLAPEILDRKYNNKVDVYAFGMMIYCILFEVNNPYQKTTTCSCEQVIREMQPVNFPLHVKNCELRPKILPEIKIELGKDYGYLVKLMEMCWKKDASDRPSFESICNILHGKMKHHQEMTNMRENESSSSKGGGGGKQKRKTTKTTTTTTTTMMMMIDLNEKKKGSRVRKKGVKMVTIKIRGDEDEERTFTIIVGREDYLTIFQTIQEKYSDADLKQLCLIPGNEFTSKPINPTVDFSSYQDVGYIIEAVFSHVPKAIIAKNSLLLNPTIASSIKAGGGMGILGAMITESFNKNIEELRSSLNKKNRECVRAEKMHKQEIFNLKRRMERLREDRKELLVKTKRLESKVLKLGQENHQLVGEEEEEEEEEPVTVTHHHEEEELLEEEKSLKTPFPPQKSFIKEEEEEEGTKKVKKLESILKTLRTQLQKKVKENGKLRIEMQVIKNSAEQLKQEELQNFKEEVMKLRSENKNLKEQLLIEEEISSKKKEESSSSQNLSKKVVSLMSKNRKLEAEIRDLKTQQQQQQSHSSSVEERKSEGKNIILNIQDEIDQDEIEQDEIEQDEFEGF